MLRKEEGFRAYYKANGKNNEIMKVDIRKTDYPSVEKILAGIHKDHPDIKAIFATNSKMSSVACYVEKSRH